MPEKINGQGFRPTDPSGTRRTDGPGRSQGQSGTATPASGAAETVDVARSELLISRLEEALEAVPAVDAGRVLAVRDAIASGNYQIDPYRIADQILRLERDIDY